MGENPVSNVTNNGNIKVSFADLVKGKKPYMLTDSDLLSLPEASTYGDEPALVLPNELLQEGRDIFQFSLIGRLNFKGLKLADVQKRLEEQWGFGAGSSKLVPMTKGFFIIKLTSAENKERVWHGDTWVIQNQQLRVFNFYPNFDPEIQQTSRASVWVSFPGLYIELWTKKILISIAKIIGKPTAIDQKTLDHDVGNYAAVLINIDFAKLIPKRIRLEANGKEFWQYIEIQDLENVKFCTHCKFMGHKFENCLAAKKILGGSNAEKKSPTVNIKSGKEEKSSNPVWKEVSKTSNVNVQAGKESIISVHEVAVHDEEESIREKDDDKQLEEQLEKAFSEYRDAQIKLMRCKNNISAKQDMAVRSREAQQESVVGGSMGGPVIQVAADMNCTPTSNNCRNHEKEMDGKQPSSVGGSGSKVAVENCKPTLNKSTPITKDSVYGRVECGGLINDNYMGLKESKHGHLEKDNQQKETAILIPNKANNGGGFTNKVVKENNSHDFLGDQEERGLLGGKSLNKHSQKEKESLNSGQHMNSVGINVETDLEKVMKINEKKKNLNKVDASFLNMNSKKQRDEVACSSTKAPTPVQLAFRNGGRSSKDPDRADTKLGGHNSIVSPNKFEVLQEESDTNEDIGQDIRARMRIHDEEVAKKTKTQHGSTPMTIEDVDKLFPPEMENYETMRKLYKFQFDIT